MSSLLLVFVWMLFALSPPKGYDRTFFIHSFIHSFILWKCGGPTDYFMQHVPAQAVIYFVNIRIKKTLVGSWLYWDWYCTRVRCEPSDIWENVVNNLLFTMPMNINGYVLIKTLDTIVREDDLLTVSDSDGYSVEAAWRGCRRSPAITSCGWPPSSHRGPFP